jgi:hypothetical protein
MFKQINEINTWKSKLFSSVKYKILSLNPKKLTNNIATPKTSAVDMIDKNKINNITDLLSDFEEWSQFLVLLFCHSKDHFQFY